MKLRSPGPFWPARDGLIESFPPLERDASCEVAIVGGGLSGAMVAHTLASAGVETIVLDRRDIGTGSTAASTALVLYEPDTNLSDLISLRGELAAVRSYRACLASVERLEEITRGLENPASFERKSSVYLASRPQDVPKLRVEFDVRQRNHIDVTLLERGDIRANFSFSRPMALLTREAGQVDPFRLTYELLTSRLVRGHLGVYDQTEVCKFEPTKTGAVLKTSRGSKVSAKRVVFASGFETIRFLRRRSLVRLKSTFAFASEPVSETPGWGFDRCLMWESSRPYLYLRTTSDGRIMAGGEDEDFLDPDKRDALIPEKTSALVRRVKRLFPRIRFEVAYAWAGTFGETEDSLPYVGEVKGFPHAYFALCYGANGTNFAVLAADIIRDLYLGRENPNSELFAFDRRINNAGKIFPKKKG